MNPMSTPRTAASSDARKRLSEKDEAVRCGAVHPTNASVIDCQLERGHEGNHYSTSGCAGGGFDWRQDITDQPPTLPASIDEIDIDGNLIPLADLPNYARRLRLPIAGARVTDTEGACGDA